MLAVSIALAYPKCGLSAQGDTLLEVSGGHGLWTLEDCIDYALEHNIEIKRQELVPDDRRSALSDARWSYVPSFPSGAATASPPGVSLMRRHMILWRMRLWEAAVCRCPEAWRYSQG